MPVIIDATAHRRAWRDLARASIKRFAEVQIDCPLEVARAREQRAHERRGAARHLRRRRRAGRHRARSQRALRARSSRPSSPSTPSPRTPPRRASGSRRSGCAGTGSAPPAGARRRGALAHRPARQRQDDAGLAHGRAAGGRRRGRHRSRVAALRALAPAAPWAAEHDEEIAHRALAYTAKLLADAGLVVVVDATAPRRAWRALAREIVDTFAEVQLVVRSEVCLDRERAVRWRPHAWRRPRRRPTWPSSTSIRSIPICCSTPRRAASGRPPRISLASLAACSPAPPTR